MNTNNYSRYKIREFAENMFEEYNEKTYLKELGDRRFYDPEEGSGKEFVQIGKRYSEMQGEWFDPNKKSWIGEDIPSQTVNNLVSGELNYLIEKFKESIEDKSLEVVLNKSFELQELERALSKFENTTHVIVPKEVGKELINLNLKTDKIRDLDGRARFFQIDGQQKIIVANKDSDLDDILLVDRKEIEVIQKLRTHKPAQEEGIELIDDYSDVGEDEPLMLYFGKKENKKDIDFLFRTIFRVEVKPEDIEGIKLN